MRAIITTISATVEVVLEPGDDNWSAYAPGVPGAFATGRDQAEVERSIREAVEIQLEHTASIEGPAMAAAAVQTPG